MDGTEFEGILETVREHGWIQTGRGWVRADRVTAIDVSYEPAEIDGLRVSPETFHLVLATDSGRFVVESSPDGGLLTAQAFELRRAVSWWIESSRWCE